MVSKIYSVKSEGSLGEKAGKIYAEIGFKGLWVFIIYIFIGWFSYKNYYDRYFNWFIMVDL